jgi:hypothetical protein
MKELSHFLDVHARSADHRHEPGQYPGAARQFSEVDVFGKVVHGRLVIAAYRHDLPATLAERPKHCTHAE